MQSPKERYFSAEENSKNKDSEAGTGRRPVGLGKKKRAKGREVANRVRERTGHTV